MPTFDPNWKTTYAEKIVTAGEAVQHIHPGDNIFIGTGCAAPQALVQALSNDTRSTADNQIFHLLTMGSAPYAYEKLSGKFRFNSFFIAENVREAVWKGMGDYTPIFLSDIPRLFESGLVPIDVCLIQVTPPNADGMCSLGISVDIVKSAVENGRVVIAEVNSRMPWLSGDCLVPASQIDLFVSNDTPLLTLDPPPLDEDIKKIGRNIAEMIEDGSTLELGIGSVPQALVEFLKDKKDLGIHTEMFTDSLVDLIESGVVNCSKKTINRGKVVASFIIGSEKLYEFVNNNPMIEMHPSEYVNDPFVISQHNNMVAINMALEIDLTGQVCADSIGHKFYSGIGGQVDFNRGAARSTGGKAIIAMKSTAKGSTISKIVADLSPGAGVVTTRGDVHYVVTEYGVAHLHGRSIRERAMALISIAHPKFRNELLRKAKELNYIYTDQVELPWEKMRYPVELEKWQAIDDGTELFFRPIRPTDETALRMMFYDLSKESVYRRFFQQIYVMPHERAQSFVNINYEDNMAIVAVTNDSAGEKILGVGRYVTGGKKDNAEVDFMVRDEWQGRGIGRALLNYLVEIARTRKLKKFEAAVVSENKQMLHLFRTSGLKDIASKFEEGVYYLEMGL